VIKKIFGLVSVSILAFSCSSLIRTASVDDALNQVLMRHDDYVTSDETLTPESIDVFLGQAAAARNGVHDEMTPAAFHALIDQPVMRHQAYVQSDITITELERRVWLRSGKLLLEVGR